MTRLRSRWARDLSQYLDEGHPLSISDRSGIYSEVEAKLEALGGVSHALLCNSGTSALLSAYFALGIKPGDEVICPSWTFFATLAPAMFLGARPKFVDVEPETGNIDFVKLKKALSKKTKAIAVVHSWGHAADIMPISELARSEGIPLIEDCAHAPFGRASGKVLGSFGDLAILSFHDQKVISTGEGGALLTSDPGLYERAVLLGHYLGRAKGLGPAAERLWETGFGLKLRMHPLAAVMLRPQLNGLETVLRQRELVFDSLRADLVAAGFKPYPRATYVDLHCYYTFKIQFRLEQDLETWQQIANSGGVHCSRASSKPLTYYPLFAGTKGAKASSRIADHLWSHSLSFRTGQTVDDAIQVSNEVRRTFNLL